MGIPTIKEGTFVKMDEVFKQFHKGDYFLDPQSRAIKAVNRDLIEQAQMNIPKQYNNRICEVSPGCFLTRGQAKTIQFFTTPVLCGCLRLYTVFFSGPM